ncbi:hypothetical protein HYH03_007124 [Edaphochlamys debaryana]|uniref:Protein kinase domain-containing protein n=1 Tax=Edaphochlamys debaryana TaxID=47281 RepID=A0A835Y646_9CHLO|nr:hypothetical protein HYH03_007124 [Edaphochlamys debaryana]|eukprot:KAG2494886.1 hypothetical protein HYH03_007124 [Edaphochlamys debaryana]
MVSLFACCRSTRTLPVSPNGAPSARPAAESVDAASVSHSKPQPGYSKLGAGDGLKYADALLPGQLPPDSPRDVDSHLHANGKQGPKGVPLLEDTLTRDARQRPDPTASPGAGPGRPGQRFDPKAPPPRLQVPAELQSGTSFADDFRSGEQVSAQATASGPPLLKRGSSRNLLLGAPSTGGPAASSAPAPSASQLDIPLQWLLPTGPLGQAVSRSSGQRHLVKQVRVPSPSQPSQLGVGFSAPAGPGAGAGAGQGQGQPVSSPRGAESLAAIAAQAQAVLQLNRELALAAQLPRCPQLLLPHKVYEQGDVAHVVYDGAGEELFTYLRARQRLPEACCRDILRQLLQALSALHERRWVHRNVCSETVWVTELAQPSVLGEEASAQDDLLPSPTDPHTNSPTTAGGPSSTSGQAPPGTEGTAALLNSPTLKRNKTLGRDRNVDRALRKHATSKKREARLGVRLGGLAHVAQLGESAAAGGGAGGGKSGTRGGAGGGAGAAGTLRELVGCAYHLAPEAIRGEGYGQAADVWAAGVLLCMLLTGRPPFPGMNELEVMTRVLLSATDPSRLLNDVGTADGAGGGGDADGGVRRPRFASVGGAEPAKPRKLGRGYSVRESAAAVVPERQSTGGLAAVEGTDAGEGDSSPLRALVVQVALEARASGACREALASMLAADPAARLSAADLLQLPWFTSTETGD